ncbi:MAG: patatin-like phospholipase family protein [Candidatus Zixiibacteriota bacterium]
MSNEENANVSNKGDAERWGLALSGGGFRASFFHIGVLAVLAEKGLLKKMEVISTVSGGSIIGAMYYLRLKHMLEEYYDFNYSGEGVKLKNKDYIELVEKLADDFIEGTKFNIRTRVFSNWWYNFKMAKPNYSRTDRLGQLYDEQFYGNGNLEMRCMKIFPKGEPIDFHPNDGNEKRGAKVPKLLINSTALNTGHNWRFQADKMGEAPLRKAVEREIDKNMELKRPSSWDDIVPLQQDVKVGEGVAASSCVPGLFHPLAISDMYDPTMFDGAMRNIRVQLVDGGVHDNLGTAGLITEGCTHFIVSDASGQMKDEYDPSTNLISVLGRMNSILMDRVREEELFRLNARYGIRGFEEDDEKPGQVYLLHNRKGLRQKKANYTYGTCDNIDTPGDKLKNKPCLTEFKVDKIVQEHISKIRTDLDSFSAIEANALIMDAYLMSEYEFANYIPNDEDNDLQGLEVSGGFKDLKELMAHPTNDFKKHLKAGQKSAFKVFITAPWRSGLITAGIALFLFSIIFWGGRPIVKTIVGLHSWLYQFDLYSVPVNSIFELFSSWSTVLITIVILIIISVFPKLSRHFDILPGPRKGALFLIHLVTRFIIPCFKTIVVWVHLISYDRLFQYAGRLDHFVKKDATTKTG